MDYIVHLIRASIHIERTCNTKLAHNYTNKRSWCKLANEGNLNRITDPTYFISDNRVKEMFTRIVITTQVPQELGASKSQAKTILDVGGFHLALNMTIVLVVHALHFSKMANWKMNER